MPQTDRRQVGLSVITDTSVERGRIVSVEKGVMARNNAVAERNRLGWHALGVLTLNLLSAPGSGKTTLLCRTLEHFRSLRPAVIVGDLATDNDADRLARTGAATVQIQTGSLCHLEAAMIERACDALDLRERRLLFIENVGNLVCPASYDLGETLRVVMLSSTEGEDKPLKYPTIFRRADLVLVNKMDLAEAACFDRNRVLEAIRAVAPQATVLELSALKGQGMDAWYAYLEANIERCAREHGWGGDD